MGGTLEVAEKSIKLGEKDCLAYFFFISVRLNSRHLLINSFFEMFFCFAISAIWNAVSSVVQSEKTAVRFCFLMATTITYFDKHNLFIL